jgi:hypothetical protein
MPNSDKEILRMFAKYAEMVNATLDELHSRVYAIHSPDVKPPLPSPCLHTQLSAIRTAIEKLPG